MDKLSYDRHRFPSIVIQQAVWLYFRFALSYRDVEDMLAERGIDVSYETVRRWALKFGTIIARKLRRGRPRPDGRWHLDEVFISINGRQFEVLDILVQPRRDRKAALKLMRKLLKKQGVTPATIVTDKLSRLQRWPAASHRSLAPLRRGFSLSGRVPIRAAPAGFSVRSEFDIFNVASTSRGAHLSSAT